MVTIPETEIEQGEIPDTYLFWGLIQRSGEVTPANRESSIYYTPQVVQNSPSVVGSPVRVSHVRLPNNDAASNIGEVIAQSFLKENLFGLLKITRQGWNQFENAVEQGNGNIRLSYDELVEQINDGSLALSAGLGVSLGKTAIHDRTVTQIARWSEVSVVQLPAVPGSYAWACDGECSVVFDQEQTMQELDIDVETLRQSVSGDTAQVIETLESDNEAVVQLEADGTARILDDVEQECGCEDTDVQQLKEERDKYKNALEEIQQSRKENAEQRLRDVNQSLPEEKQRSEEQIEQMVDGANVEHLNQTADMLEDLVSTSTPVQQSNEEDLSGSSDSGSPDPEVEQAKNQVDSVCQELFGQGADEVFSKVEQGEFGA